MIKDTRHLDDDLFQAHLEGELDDAASLTVTGHLTVCAECTARMEEWALLLRDLSDLPSLEPSAGLSDRVMATVPPPAPAAGLLDRVRGALPATWAGNWAGSWARSQRHARPRAIQDMLDCLMGHAARVQLRAHASGCATCREELAAWERVYHGLGRLGHYQPSPGFRLRVMEQLHRMTAHAQASVPSTTLDERWLRAARTFLPTSRRGWAAACTLLATPAIGVLALVVAVFLHPLLTLADLAAFVGWRAADVVQLASGWVVRWIGGTPILLSQTGLIAEVVSSPGLAAMGAAALWALVSAAGWIIYRHVVAPALLTSRHAHAPS